MLFTPMLAFLRPFLLLIGKATFFTNVEGLPVFLHLLDHRLTPHVEGAHILEVGAAPARTFPTTQLMPK